MTGIFKGIQAIIESMLLPLHLIRALYDMIIRAKEIINSALETINAIILTLPNWLVGYAVLSIAVIVIMRMIGRETK